MFAPTGGIGTNIMGGQTTGSEMFDSCDFERESEEYGESEMDKQSLPDDMEADNSTITLHDVSEVDMTDQSECDVVSKVPVEPEIVVIKASKPVCKVLTDPSQVFKNTPLSKMSEMTPKCTKITSTNSPK